MDSSSSPAYDYQLNIYYGIYFPTHMFKQVYGLIATYDDFKKLDTDDAAAVVEKVALIATTNTDRAGAAAHAMIAVDKMTIGGPDSDNPSDTFMSLDPVAMCTIMGKNSKCVEVVERLYKNLVRDLKIRGEPISGLKMGWTVMNCTFEQCSSCSESTEEVKKAPKKKTPPKESAGPAPAAPTTAGKKKAQATKPEPATPEPSVEKKPVIRKKPAKK